MKLYLTFLCRRTATVLLVATGLLSALTQAQAQTVFTANGLSGSVAGVSSNVAAVGLLYNVTGATTNSITGVTFGNSFTMTDSSSTGGSYDNTFIIGGTISGDSILAGTSIGISYDFTLAKSIGVTSDANWTLLFSDSVNNPSGNVGSASVVASGTLSSASTAFSGTGSYNYVSGVNATDTFRVFLEVSYTGILAAGAPIIDGTMNNTGFGGGGITIGASAVPEPSTYALIAGVAMLGFTTWRRRKQAVIRSI